MERDHVQMGKVHAYSQYGLQRNSRVLVSEGEITVQYC